jgi:Pyruvate/2-oxoacid:ferredoxin oxidoreductase gamma subunit
MSVLTAVREDMCYCPGCSHGLVLERLGKAIDRLNLPADKVCIVSDIGCIGTADRYFSCHTFHGLHGRSFTYAEGIRRYCPDLLTIVLVGDGGCGIGTAHLVHAARRGVPIKVIVCNNFNFGMTGGQHSPATLANAITPTTPRGFHERPFDIAETARVSGAGFVARGSAHDANIADLMESALRSPGFALLDVWELCSAYFVLGNKLTPARLPESAEKAGMRFGVLAEAAPAAIAQAAPMPAPAPAKAPSAPRSAAPQIAWPRRTEISFAGSAGQYIRSAVGVLGEIAVACGLYAAEHDDYPITVRKGHSISNLIVESRPILYAGLDHPDLVILLSADGAARLGSLRDLPKNCTVLVENALPLPETDATVERFDAAAFARAASRQGAALAVLSSAIVQRGWITGEALCTAAQAVLRGPHRDANLKSIEAGCLAPAS